MLKCISSNFMQHTPGAWRTDWHYRTSHLLKDILAAGDDYWLPIVNLLRVGDEIIVESDQLSWRYWLSVRQATMHPVPRVTVKLLNPLDISNGVQIFDYGVEKDKEEALEAEKTRLETDAKNKALAEAALISEEHKPSVRWRGPHDKWTVMGYDRPAKTQYDSRESAQACIDNNDLEGELLVNRDVSITEKSRTVEAA